MKNKMKYMAVVALLFALTGCGLWENFTTYFNRYFNAKQKFEEAEEIIQTETKRELFEFREPRVSPKANTALDAVIEKCSNILQWNKESGYVEEAILMIGKSYYYRGNYTKALRKFRELEGFPDSDLALENKLWVGKSELQMRRFEDGMQTLDEVKAEAAEEGEDDFLIDAILSQIRFAVYRENYTTAINYANNLLVVSNSSELSAEVSYEVGKLYVKTNDYENASIAFENVFDYSPTFDIEFETQVEYANVLKMLGRLDESMDILTDLRDENKYSDYWDKVDLEIGNIHYAKKELEEALDMFILVDTTYSASENAGIAAFNRAELIEKEYFEFDSAKILYDRVNKIKAPVDHKNRARERSLLLVSRREYTDEIFTNERQLTYLRDSSLYVSDLTAYDEYFAAKDSLAVLFVEMKELEGSDFDSTEYVMKEDPPFLERPVYPSLPEDSLITNICERKYELGNLYFVDLEVPDSAYSQYVGILNTYPRNKFEAKTLYALGSYYLTIDDKEKADSLFLEVYENHNYDPVANAAAEKLGLGIITSNLDPAEQKYIIAEDLYLNNEYESAIDSLYNISESYPESPLAAKSLFTIGWILENDLKMPDSAATVYDTLVARYERTDYASSVSKKLGAYRSWEKQVQDSLLLIEQALKDSLAADSLNNLAVADSMAVSDSLSISDSSAVPDSLGTGETDTGEGTTEQDTTSTPDQGTDALKEENESTGGKQDEKGSQGNNNPG